MPPVRPSYSEEHPRGPQLSHKLRCAAAAGLWLSLACGVQRGFDDTPDPSNSETGEDSEHSSGFEPDPETGGEPCDDGELTVCGGEACDLLDPASCEADASGRPRKCTAVTCQERPLPQFHTVSECVPVDGNKGLGERCTSIGTTLDDGRDDCGPGLFCDLLGSGTCRAYCRDEGHGPQCPTALECDPVHNGTLAICRARSCDPFDDDCGSDHLCLPDLREGRFACLEAMTPERAQYGERCDQGLACDSGLLCVAGKHVDLHGCESPTRCCSLLCDRTQDHACPDAAALCGKLPWPGDLPPPAQAHVGVCIAGATP